MSTTEPATTKEKKPSYIDKVYFDSRSGEELTVRKYLCHRCNQYIRADGLGHPACQKEALAEEAANVEKERQERCITKYGRVVSRAEEEWMDYPDYKVSGYGETYNQHLKRIAREKEEAYYKKLRDRELRKARLPEMEREIVSLKAQIARDEKESAEETKQKEQETADVTKQASTQQIVQEEEDIEQQLQTYVKARGIQ